MSNQTKKRRIRDAMVMHFVCNIMRAIVRPERSAIKTREKLKVKHKSSLHYHYWNSCHYKLGNSGKQWKHCFTLYYDLMQSKIDMPFNCWTRQQRTGPTLSLDTFQLIQNDSNWARFIMLMQFGHRLPVSGTAPFGATLTITLPLPLYHSARSNWWMKRMEQ